LNLIVGLQESRRKQPDAALLSKHHYESIRNHRSDRRWHVWPSNEGNEKGQIINSCHQTNQEEDDIME
jgi:hypothetical protein